jgi:glycosyltransferase involved in cell wall biosynthesis
VIVGGDDVSYGRPPEEGGGWRARLLAELGGRLDLARVHFVGRLPYERYVSLLQVSAAHVYLTYPFVLSWSMLEAMAAGCMVIGSATSPVEEVLTHRQNGVLVDFFARDQLADAVCWALDEPEAARALRAAARRTVVERFALERCLAAQEAFLDGLARTRPAAPKLRSIA